MKYEIKHKLGEQVYVVFLDEGYASIVWGVIEAMTKGYSDGVFSHTYHVKYAPGMIRYVHNDEDIFSSKEDATKRLIELLK